MTGLTEWAEYETPEERKAYKAGLDYGRLESDKRITELEACEKVVIRIAGQLTYSECEDLGGGDYEEAYDSFVRQSRQVLRDQKPNGGADEQERSGGKR